MKTLKPLLALALFNTTLAATFTDAGEFPTWAEDAIELVNDEGIMTGYGDGTFGPDKFLTRAEAVTLILRTKQDIVMANYNGIPQFPDVEDGAWYEDAIGVAAAYGWVKGHDDGNFYPGNNLTRAEFSTLLARVFDLEVEDPELSLKYEDIEPELWFTEPVSAMLEHDLLRNALNLNFRPEQAVDRAEAAWTFAQLVTQPGLLGLGAEAQYDTHDPLDSRRVAVKPRDFDANKQGYEVEREALHITAEPIGEDVVSFNLGDDWQQLGAVRVRNTFDYRADLESLRLRLRMDATDMGPSEGFLLKVEGSGLLYENKVYTNGELALTGLNYPLEIGEEVVFKVFVKGDETESFYARTATGKVFVMEADGEAFKPMESDSKVRDVRAAPIEYHTRDLANFSFVPAYEDN